MLNREVIEAVEALEEEGGRVTPAKVVEAARQKTSPLHQFFEWDDSKAAEAHRLDQARRLIRSIEYKITINRIERPVYAYVRDPECFPKTQGYRRITELRTEEDQARDALTAEFEACAARLQRARNLAVLLGLEAELDDRLDALIAMRERITPKTPSPPPPPQGEVHVGM